MIKDDSVRKYNSVRKIPFFGSSNNQLPDFKWPQKKDLLLMQKDKNLLAVGLKWKKSTGNSSYIGGIQIIL